VVRDLPRAMGRRITNELLWGRVAVLGVAIVAAVFAHLYGDLIALLGTFAFGTFGAALAPAIAVGLNWRRVTSQAAIASISVGMSFNLSLEFLSKQTFWLALPKPPLASGVLPAAVALAASFTTLFVVTWLTGRQGRATVPSDVAAIMEM